MIDMSNAKSIELATFREMADEDGYLQDAKPAVQHVRLHACREIGRSRTHGVTCGLWTVVTDNFPYMGKAETKRLPETVS